MWPPARDWNRPAGWPLRGQQDRPGLPHPVLDLELRPSGIRVNGVAPQLLNTAETRAFLSPDQLAHTVAPETIAYLAIAPATPVSGAIVPAYGA